MKFFEVDAGWLLALALVTSSAPALGERGTIRVRFGELAQGSAPADVRRLERWPEPADRQEIEIDVLRLRKASTEGMEQGAREALLAQGAATAPALLEALRKERDPAARARVEYLLERVTGAEHTRLLAQRFDDRSPQVRAFALRRAAAFPDPELRDAAEAARLRTAKELEDPKLREAERALLVEEHYRAALCCASTGSIAGLDPLLARARNDWARSAAELRTALAACKGAAATAALLPTLASPERAEVVAGLGLLAVCGVTEGTPDRIRPLLDSTDNTIRVAAINALRGVVDGDPPLERLPVFEAIEQANAWKKRL